VLLERLLVQRRHPQQAFRSCLGVLSLVRILVNVTADSGRT
jgi:hypothetical protein